MKTIERTKMATARIGTAVLVALAGPAVTTVRAGQNGGWHGRPGGPPPHASPAMHGDEAGPRGPGFAGPPPMQGGPEPGGFIETHAERLGLDDAKVAEIRKLVESSRAENETLRERIAVQHAKMRELLRVDLPDEDAVMHQVEEIGELLVDERKRQLRAILAIRKLLTPEQRRELMKIHEERREAMEKRFGRPDGPSEDAAGRQPSGRDGERGE